MPRHHAQKDPFIGFLFLGCVAACQTSLQEWDPQSTSPMTGENVFCHVTALLDGDGSVRDGWAPREQKGTGRRGYRTSYVTLRHGLLDQVRRASNDKFHI